MVRIVYDFRSLNKEIHNLNKLGYETLDVKFCRTKSGWEEAYIIYTKIKDK